MKAKQQKVAKILIVISTLHTCSVLHEYKKKKNKKQKENGKPKHTSPKHSCEREMKDKTTKKEN